MKSESKEIHNRAKEYNYDFYHVLKLLKEYMEI